MIIFGLGNPGLAYEHTRHNAGFDAISRTAAFFHVELKKRCFCKYRYAKVPGGIIVFPLTYMNNSGNAVRYFRKYLSNPSDLVVVCDNMDLAVGGLRIRRGGGSSGQKGLASIARSLESNDFVRIYVGIGRPAQGVSVTDHVLGKEQDQTKLDAYNKALDDASKAIVKLLEGCKTEELQGEFNRKGIL